jgi:hypothetical protein
MKACTGLHWVRGAVVLGFFSWAAAAFGQRLTIAANTASASFDPVSGGMYSEMRTRLQEDFPGTTFTSLPLLTGDLSRFDLIILNRFGSSDLQPAEQAAIYSYVLHGGNLVYVGEAIGPPNDTFTVPFGIVMTPDRATDIPIAFATFSNPGHPFLCGPFGAPSNEPSGSYAAQVVARGASVELARWQGGGVAISAFEGNTLAPGAGFGIFLTDVNMITPNRYSWEVGPVLSNALSIRMDDRPALGIAHAAGGVTLTWDARAVGWILQVSEDLGSWTDLGPVIAAPGSCTDTSGGTRCFYRLQR